MDFLALELAKVDFLALQRVDGVFSEKAARYFFKQLLRGLEHCHQSGIAHRDIKPQNLLLGRDLELKLSDFGFAHDLNKNGETCSQLMGTDGFISPQIHSQSGSYSPVSADLFAAAVCLFTWVVGHLPFKQAEKSDPYYKCIVKKRLDIFWRCHERRMKERRAKPISKELKELLGAMLQKDEEHRPAIQAIFESKWMQEPAPTAEKIEMELDARLWLLELEQSRKAEKKRKEKAIRQAEKMSDATADASTGDEQLSNGGSCGR